MFFQCHSDGDSSAPSTNGDWPEADDEKEDERMQQSEDVEVDVMKEVKTTIHNGGPVDGEVDVPAEVLVSMQSMPAKVPSINNASQSCLRSTCSRHRRRRSSRTRL